MLRRCFLVASVALAVLAHGVGLAVGLKPVFHAEYDLSPAPVLPTARKLGFSSLRKHLSLDA